MFEKISTTQYQKLEHQNSQNSDYLRFGGESGILANQLSKILKSPLLIFVIKIPKSPLKLIFLKRSPVFHEIPHYKNNFS